jgi:CO/xanthine dehydrogenase Mo-binding subunit
MIKNKRFRKTLPITVRCAYRPSMKAAADTGVSYDENVFAKPSLAAAVVEVEIDAIDYYPKIKGIWLAVQTGKIHSQKAALCALRLSTLRSMGWMFSERLKYVDGGINMNPSDFMISDPLVPPISINIDGIGGKSCGLEELPYSTVPAAFSQAVSQAADKHMERLPISAKDIWNVQEKMSTS